MARIKATCSKCGKTISLFFDDDKEEWESLRELKKGEMFEHKCPACEEWAAFEVAED